MIHYCHSYEKQENLLEQLKPSPHFGKRLFISLVNNWNLRIQRLILILAGF